MNILLCALLKSVNMYNAVDKAITYVNNVLLNRKRGEQVSVSVVMVNELMRT